MAKVIIFSAPSGTGKSTIIARLMEDESLALGFSISCTSRKPRGKELDGVEYHFLSLGEFQQKIRDDEFLEYEEVYPGGFYGTLKSEVERQLALGRNVVFDIDVKGAMNIKRYFKSRALALFIEPPSLEALKERLLGRKTDTLEVIETRLKRAEYELSCAKDFDLRIVNDDLERAVTEVRSAVSSFLKE